MVLCRQICFNSLLYPSLHHQTLWVHAWALPPPSRFQGIMEEGICPLSLARANWHPGPSGLCPCGLPITSIVSPCRTPASDSVPCSTPANPLHSHWESAIISQKPQQSDPKGLGIPPLPGSCDGVPLPCHLQGQRTGTQAHIKATTPLHQPLGLKASHSNKTGKPLLAMKSLLIPFKNHYYHHYWSDRIFWLTFTAKVIQWAGCLPYLVSSAFPLDDSPKHQLQLSLIPGPCMRPTADALPSPGCLLCSLQGKRWSQSPIHPTHSLHWTHEEKHLLKTHRLLRTGKKATSFLWDTHRLSVPAFLLSECQTWANWTSPGHLLMNSCVWNLC